MSSTKFKTHPASHPSCRFCPCVGALQLSKCQAQSGSSFLVYDSDVLKFTGVSKGRWVFNYWFLFPTSPLLLGNTSRSTREWCSLCVSKWTKETRRVKLGEWSALSRAERSEGQPPSDGAVQGRGRQEGFGALDKRGKVSAPMIERSPRTTQPLRKINYENSRRNLGYVGHPLVKCNTTFEFAECAVKGSLSF
jgi:hypothetical protein